MNSTGPIATVHGVFVSIDGVGVLITGESGTGKSQIALELISTGHKLIADDVVEIAASGNSLTGSAPEGLRGVLEVNGIGLIDVQRLYGDAAVVDRCKVDMFIDIASSRDQNGVETVFGANETKIFDVRIPGFVLSSERHRDLALLIEISSRIFRDPVSLLDVEDVAEHLAAVR